MTVENISIDVKTNAGTAAKHLNSLSVALGKVSTAAGGLSNGNITALANAVTSLSQSRVSVSVFNSLATGITRLGDALKTVTAEDANVLDKIATSIAKLQGVDLKGFGSAIGAARRVSAAQAEQTPISAELQGFIESATQIDVLEAKLESLRIAMQEAFDAGNMDKAYSLRGQIIQTEAAIERATAAAEKNAEATKKIGDEADKSAKKTGGLLASLKRIAMYRILRTVIKNITQAFSEGLQNAYAFSQGINGTLAKAMDTLAAKSLTMKNQLGAALGNLLTAITPILLQIISLATQAAQALSALFSAIGGGQYLVAKDVATQWKKATGAAKEYKNTILGFDEINRLNDESGGGGGGVDALDMFELGELPEWAQWIQDHLDAIKKAAEAIALAFAAWKIGSLIADLAGVSLSMSQLLGLAAAVAGAFLLVDGAIDAFKNGTTWENVNQMLIGTSLLAGGLALAFGRVGGAIGLLVGGVTLITTALADFIKKGELTEQSFYALEGGVLAVGAGLALLTGSWIPLAVAALAGLILAIGTHTDEINRAVDTFFNDVILSVDGFLQNIQERTGINLEGLRSSIMYVLNYIRFYIEGCVLKIGWMVEDLGRIVKAVADGDWEEAWSGMQRLVSDASIVVSKQASEMAKAVTDSMMSGKDDSTDFGKAFTDIMIDVRNEFDATSGTADAFGLSLDKMFPEATKAAKEFSGSFESVAQSVQGNLNLVDNSIGTVLGRLASLKTAFDTTNSDIGAFRNNYGAIFGEAVRGNALGYASGGTINNDGTLFVAGEAGPEIVANMGGKTGVMNVDQMEAAVANGNMGVINAVYGMANMIVKAISEIDPDITLDGESLADKMYRYNQNAANRYGAAMVT